MWIGGESSQAASSKINSFSAALQRQEEQTHPGRRPGGCWPRCESLAWPPLQDGSREVAMIKFLVVAMEEVT